jgi:hypothetical protein
MSRDQQAALLDACEFSGVKFLYISPERLASDSFLERIKEIKIALLAVDEAHCISQWGYDFRPSYLKISRLRGAVYLCAYHSSHRIGYSSCDGRYSGAIDDLKTRVFLEVLFYAPILVL